MKANVLKVMSQDKVVGCVQSNGRVEWGRKKRRKDNAEGGGGGSWGKKEEKLELVTRQGTRVGKKEGGAEKHKRTSWNTGQGGFCLGEKKV